MSARGKIITMICVVLLGLGASIGLIFWSTGVDDLSIKKALTSQDIAIQALRVGRNTSEQLRDAREIILFGMDSHADFATHKNYALSAFSKWGDYLEDYALLSGESSGAAAGTERQKSFLALKNQYNNIDVRVETAIESHQEGNQARAAAELNAVVLGEYDKEFLPGIEKEINTDRSLADDAKGKAIDHSRFARRTSIIVIPVVALIVIVLSIILTRDIVSSMEKLKKGAEQLGEGNLTVRVDLDKRDEFGSLARAFNKMAQDLSDSRKELEIINAELAGFAHTVSHDLKGPLAAIMLAGPALREAIDNPEQESLGIDELLAIIEANIEKSSNLIDDVLSLAEAG
ncbi:MAG: HAMP domain-containing protein, partial [Actinobacteria bacterium]|nr:HAMP domain-containing protein [Actinomycetota bacterium]